ncbi:RNA-binding domain-containing protein, partial [Ramicandelaber brevisporus]
RPLRRLYVGSINPALTEGQIMTFINDLMSRHNLALGPGACVTQIHYKPRQKTDNSSNSGNDRGFAFAFVEFRNAEEATNALALDGAPLMGYLLTIKRQHQQHQPPLITGSAIGRQRITNHVPNSANKLYIGQLPFELSEQDIIDYFETVGPLKAFHLVRDQKTDVSRGFAFAEYADSVVTAAAIEAFSGKALGEKPLVVQLASTPGSTSSVYYGSNTQASVHIPPQLVHAITRGSHQPSTAIQIMNVFSERDVRDDVSKREIMDTIRAECNTYGHVQDLYLDAIVPSASSEHQSRKLGEHLLSKIVVRFGTVGETAAALHGLSGRRCDGRTILVSYLVEKQ